MTPRVLGLLLLLYPRAWRARYADELAYVVAEATAAGGSSWGIGADLVRGATRERARALGLTGAGLTPVERATGGCVAVLWAWAAFVAAGAVVQKTSEHWQGAVPAPDRTVPGAAFVALVTCGAVGGALVLVGIALTLPRIVAMLAGGGWAAIRGPARRAAAATLVAIAWAVVLGVWARRLSAVQRDGGDHLYGVAFVGWALAVVVALIAWAAVAAIIARRIALSRRLLVAETACAATTTGAMALMSVAAVVWWRAVADVAPGFFGAGPAPIAGAVALMTGATLLGIAGTSRAARELRLV